MRISTSQIYGTSAAGIMDNQSSLYKLQNQLSTGKKVQSAKDNPVAAAQVLLNTQSLAVTTQYANNQGTATDLLALEEDRLQSIVDSVQYIKEQVVAGTNATYSDSQRSYIAQNLQSQYEYLLGIANGTDSAGNYLFSGFQGDTKPFQQLSDGSVVYAGDDGERTLQVSSTEQMAISDSGGRVFQNIRTGNGTFSLGADASNTGNGVIASGSVSDISSWSGNNYSISFTSPTTFDITDTTTGALVSSETFTAGNDVTSIPGISFAISGAPAAGDSFTVSPSTNQSVFTTLKNLIDAYNTPVSGDATATATQRNAINIGMDNLDRVLENVSSVQASIGSRRAELTALSSTSSALQLHYQERISNLQDVDYAATISQFSQMQLQLQAAQSAFAKVSGLSLFNYL
ncbi:flagellar hook-associated protein FlgL [Propionivibrio dicarboxylicus]|uniref:Flagellar hook-associated protein 3 FlgL n=1 Tax=Propionivibrio dicarboxylicus TaxID=83767 RepID=A0A1G8HDZ8_9RHOO|nr:flagellar hook-associated protein FlgL [Propionivibrio dicarboxylicus]SDI04907.1 flagellar hook-associated protein 3 FlgL [Propionivibrio dicarboxylicus]